MTFTFLQLRRRWHAPDLFTLTLIDLHGVNNKFAPNLELISNIKQGGCLLEFISHFSGDVIQRMNISLRGHASGIKKNKFLIIEYFNKKFEKGVDVVVLILKEFCIDEKAHDLLEQTVHDVVPSVFGKVLLSEGGVPESARGC
jgi:hypothetical protein